MSTQLQMVNRVLRRLREDTVSTVTENDYSILIAEFLNAGIEEVTEAHDWRRYERTSFVTVPADTLDVDVARTTGGGGAIAAGPVLSARTKVLWTEQDIPAVVFCPLAYASALTDDDWTRMWPMSAQEIDITARQEVDYDTNQYSLYFDLYTESTDVDGRYMKVWPKPAQESTIMIAHWSPPAILAVDGTDDATELDVPERPVFEYTLMMALNERGEEIGEPGNTAEQRYYTRLAAAIEDDIDIRQRQNRYDWRRD